MNISNIIIISIFALVIPSWSEDLPDEANRLRDQRAEAISKINSKYLEELEKIKIKFTKAGNLEKAMAIDAEIKNNQQNAEAITTTSNSGRGLSESSIIGEYKYTYMPNGYNETWVFKKDSQLESFNFQSKGDAVKGKWSIKGSSLYVEKPDVSYIFDLGTFVASKITGAKGPVMIQRINK